MTTEATRLCRQRTKEAWEKKMLETLLQHATEAVVPLFAAGEDPPP